MMNQFSMNKVSFTRRIISLLLALIMVTSLSAPAGAFLIAVTTTESIPGVGELASPDGLVRIAYGPDAGIPDGSSVTIEEIAADDLRYEVYYQSAAAQVEGNFSSAYFYDIKIVTSAGEPVHPQASVHVSVNRPGMVGTPVVLHFEDEETILDPMVPLTSAKSLRGVTAELTVNEEIIEEEVTGDPFYPATEIKAEETNGSVVFDTNGFSVFGFLSYTVDFAFNDHFYSMPGGSSVMLSALLHELNIDAAVSDVAEVIFSDEKFVQVVTEGEDWKLNSIKPFNNRSEYPADPV